MTGFLFGLLRSLAFILVLHSAMAQVLPSGFVAQEIATGLDPTDLVITPDNRVLITIKSGKIFVVENDQLLPNTFLDITAQVDNFNERGLGHLVLDPDFELNNYYYVFYTVKNTNRNRISRFTANGNTTLPGSELILLELDPMSGSIHNGGDMAFGPDGKLYVSTGDGGNPSSSQSKTSLLGKILRMNKDGSIPADNPFMSDPTYTGIYKLIYALGLRNPFSMDIQPGTGRIFACDVGQETWEEVNHILPGRNYGWPLIEGPRTSQPAPPNYQDPFYAYTHAQGCSVIGAAFYNPALPSFPPLFQGKFFFADYCAGYINALDPASGNVQSFASAINRPLAFAVNQTGQMYYLQRAGMGGGSPEDNTSTPNGSLWKISFTGAGSPFIGRQPQPFTAVAGESAQFSILAFGQAPLSYQWFKNGTAIGSNAPQLEITNVTPADNGALIHCVVSNSFGTATSIPALLTVTTNTRPVPVITLPTVSQQYEAGTALVFSGTATDAEDGPLSPAQLTWKIDFHHDDHFHPALPQTSGLASGEYLIPRVGETDDNVWYRIHLTATDSEGLSKTVYRDVQPVKVQFSLNTQPSGLTLLLDGQPVSTPVTVTSVKGITRVVEAPVSQQQGYAYYVFSHLNNSADRTVLFNANGDESFLAAYEELSLANGTGLLGRYYNQSRAFNGTPDLIRVDSVINFNWGGGSPLPGTITPDDFSVRWDGFIEVPATDTYTFYVVSDDGVRLRINNQTVIDAWIPQPPTEWSGSIYLQSGRTYPIRLEFFEDGGGAVIQLLWQSTLLPKQIIPKKQLYPVMEKNRIYPNPVSSSFTLEIAGTPCYWELFNANGKLVSSGLLQKVKEIVDVSALPEGIYLLRLKNPAGAETIRLIKIN
ncbi:MAG: PQQ-dependent sugar dehydrogenase [Cyclobacteriaceae bacterium]|nr:PQQ-dependent sugar dehydrogenase [Cyclobacteriaceae bacterium]MDW8331015.1 PQQ-dependent sugar dehydrogenase [Cyclobacteriaceae bacterium]